MLEIVKDENGNILAVSEFRRVDKRGWPNKMGQYVFISNIEISETCRNNGVLRKMITKIFSRVPFIQWVYFKRSKYNDRVRIYKASSFIKKIKGEIYVNLN